MNNVLRYFAEARDELTRVTWPTRTQVIEGTQVVLAFIVALTLFIFVLDLIFQKLIRLVVPQ